MKNSKNFFPKASSLVLLAFCFQFPSIAQELRSLSGANSPNDDTNPVWIGNNTLLFTRAFHPQNLGGPTDPGDIWETRKDETGEWGLATHRPDLSTAGYDLVLGLEDVLTLLVLRKEGNQTSLHQFSKFGQDWNYLREVNFPDLDSLGGQVTGRVASGGKLLFLAGKRSGGYGNEDIYLSEKTGTIDWSELQNLGPAINGFGQEMGPFYDPESSQLYFSSNSYPGANGKDILIAKKLGEAWDSWSKPEKWEQISSRGSEASITFISKDEIVWTSTQNSDGFADLMTFSTPVPLVIPSEFVAPVTPEAIIEAPRRPTRVSLPNQSETQTRSIPLSDSTYVYLPMAPITPLEEIVKAEEPISWVIIDAKNNLELPYTLTFIKGVESVDFQGTALISKLKEMGITQVKISSAGYFPKQIFVENLNANGKTVVLLTKAEAGSIVLLEDVNFKRGTAELEGETTEASLSDLALFLKENPQIKIRINGHTDNVGDPGLNKQLSLERAGSVRDFLIDMGVNFENLRISGWGGTRPIASNATEAGRAKNRRVELAVEN
ncbi:OmpA family protein [Algoriphagus boritolerans]|uniref:OmpA family protein n=1 Tax=Algoriphagus boritolerans DSM 17298 = JCM 18970 TaxID=1120964 RepID=A0A1H5TMI2_9BACT|nr:OmpA family protein [Algoriphagus boritolerans]SEF63990.1 OmpA family protein [Algoriphagus boritolerans DSM 17298 = JCM 18970]